MAESKERVGIQVRVQKFGTSLSNMVMPNIGAFIAWGLITALFIPAGFFPSERFAALVGPMITYLLPLLIGYTGGRMVYEVRGGVVGAIATMGVIVGTTIPMFIGAMIMGPLTAYIMKKLDASWRDKLIPGTEMLVDNFSAGIFAAIMAMLGLWGIGPVVAFLSGQMEIGVNYLLNNHLLPLTSIIIEPAKILFLNNAINHGIITPLGTEQVTQAGKSVLFLLEANPGPGLGILLAYMVFGKGANRASASGAAFIHFIGGIHEIYFPYVLMRPILIIPAILAGMSGVYINVLMNVGLRAPAAPGSIIAVYAQTATDSYLGVTLSVFGSALVGFLLAAPFVRFGGDKNLEEATAQMEAMKGKKSSVASALTNVGTGRVERIIFACDAGMGSSAMGASLVRKKVHGAGFTDVSVKNLAVRDLKDDMDILVVHQDLLARAKELTPSAVHVSVDNFMNSPRYDEIVEIVRKRNGDADTTVEAAQAQDDDKRLTLPELLDPKATELHGSAKDMADAIEQAGQRLLSVGAVSEAYVRSMHEREESVSTFMGSGLAIPHGTNEAKGEVIKSAISFTRLDEPVDWNGNPVTYVIGIAGQGNEHLEVLAKLAGVFSDEEAVAKLAKAESYEAIAKVLEEQE